MDSERLLFEKGCFLACWNDDEILEEKNTHANLNSLTDNKDLDTLLSELREIKEHIEDVRQRKWELEKSLMYHYHNFIGE